MDGLGFVLGVLQQPPRARVHRVAWRLGHRRSRPTSSSRPSWRRSSRIRRSARPSAPTSRPSWTATPPAPALSSRCSTSRASTPSRPIGSPIGCGTRGRQDFALYLQSRSSEVFQTDIHPAARIGRGIFLDHATGSSSAQTAVIEDNVSMLQDVTLGGTGKERGDRHPKIRRGVLIGAGAKILGNIEVGECARVAAGSVVLQPVPPQHDGGRRSGEGRRNGGLRRAGAVHGPVPLLMEGIWKDRSLRRDPNRRLPALRRAWQGCIRHVSRKGL